MMNRSDGADTQNAVADSVDPVRWDLTRRVAFTGAAAGMAGLVETLRAAPADATPAQNWSTVGNTITNTDYLGSKSVQPLIFKTSAAANTPLERMRIAPGGGVGINTTSTAANLTVVATAGRIGLRVANHATDGTGAAVYLNSDTAPSLSVANGQGNAVVINHTATNGAGTGIQVSTASATGLQVTNTSTTGQGTAVRADGDEYGVYGSASYSSGKGVLGAASNVAGIGVYGLAQGDNGYAVYGYASGQYASALTAYTTGAYGYGVVAQASGGSGVGGYFSGPAYGVQCQGNMDVSGTLTKAAGSFRIDHPLDPEHKWLSHSFVESPDMMNVYNGNVVLGAAGEATVTLPDYFIALNRDYRYQLTCIGGSAVVYIGSKVDARGRFTIAGGHPGLEVSWQVTGIRQDAYASAHPIEVEQIKTGAAAGGLQYVPKGSAARQIDPMADRHHAPPSPPTPPPTRSVPGQRWVADKL